MKSSSQAVRRQLSSRIRLKVTDSEGDKMVFKVNRHTSMAKVYAAFCRRKGGLDPSRVVLLHNGLRVLGSDTPGTLGLQRADRSRLEAVIEPGQLSTIKQGRGEGALESRGEPEGGKGPKPTAGQPDRPESPGLEDEQRNTPLASGGARSSQRGSDASAEEEGSGGPGGAAAAASSAFAPASMAGAGHSSAPAPTSDQGPPAARGTVEQCEESLVASEPLGSTAAAGRLAAAAGASPPKRLLSRLLKSGGKP